MNNLQDKSDQELILGILSGKDSMMVAEILSETEYGLEHIPLENPQLKAFAYGHELGRRRRARITLNDPDTAAKLAMAQIGHYENEHLMVFTLGAKNDLISWKILTEGTTDATLFVPRQILAFVLRSGAQAFIVAHNHPTGNLKPSPYDLHATKQLTKASGLMLLTFLDHLIVNSGDFYSLAEHNQL